MEEKSNRPLSAISLLELAYGLSQGLSISTDSESTTGYTINLPHVHPSRESFASYGKCHWPKGPTTYRAYLVTVSHRKETYLAT